MNRLQRTPPLTVVAFGVVGVCSGLLLQIWLSTQGFSPLIPPLSLPFSMLVLAAVLLGLGIALRRAVTRASEKPVNPFHAVRLLAGARAGQFAGALLGGFGGGLALQLLSRSLMPPASTWLPMLLVLGAGIVLVVCAAIAESLCRVPPGEGDDSGSEGDATGVEPEPGAA